MTSQALRRTRINQKTARTSSRDAKKIQNNEQKSEMRRINGSCEQRQSKKRLSNSVQQKKIQKSRIDRRKRKGRGVSGVSKILCVGQWLRRGNPDCDESDGCGHPAAAMRPPGRRTDAGTWPHPCGPGRLRLGVYRNGACHCRDTRTDDTQSFKPSFGQSCCRTSCRFGASSVISRESSR